MPAAVDEQIHYLGGMIAAALEGAVAGSCRAVYEYDSQHGEPRTLHPCLELYRTEETIEQRGTRSPRIRHVAVALNYYHGPTHRKDFADVSAKLADAVAVIDNVVTAQFRAGYESGANLSTLAGVEDVKITSIRYGYGESGTEGETVNPMLSMEIALQHRYERPPVSEALTKIMGDVNLDNKAPGTFGHAITQFEENV